MTEVVVTGASGFVGRAVCAELLARGVTVHAISRSTGAPIPGARHQQVADYGQLDGPAGAICIHLAGESHPRRITDREAHRAAAVGVASALAAGFARLVFASSGIVYGDRAVVPRREIDPVDPLGAYGATKRAVEEIVLAQDHAHAVARLANVYGPGMSPENALSSVLAQIPGRGGLRLRDPSAVRDFVHIEDVARGFADLALSGLKGTFNIGTGIGTSVGELAACVAKQAGENDREVVAITSNPAPSWLVLDPTKMREAVGWEAAIRLPLGLEGLIRERLSVRSS